MSAGARRIVMVHDEEVDETVNGSWRYLGCAVGFGFGAMWMTVGLGAAILSVLCAALGFGAVFIAERGRAGTATRGAPSQTVSVDEPALLLDELEPDSRRYEELHDDETYPLDVDSEWPLPPLGRRAGQPVEVASAAPGERQRAGAR